MKTSTVSRGTSATTLFVLTLSGSRQPRLPRANVGACQLWVAFASQVLRPWLRSVEKSWPLSHSFSPLPCPTRIPLPGQFHGPTRSLPWFLDVLQSMEANNDQQIETDCYLRTLCRMVDDGSKTASRRPAGKVLPDPPSGPTCLLPWFPDALPIVTRTSQNVNRSWQTEVCRTCDTRRCANTPQESKGWGPPSTGPLITNSCSLVWTYLYQHFAT